MTQCDLIRASLQMGETLTPLDALMRFGTMRLSERIRECEREGMLIDHIPCKVGKKTIMSYQLLKIPY